MEAKKKAKELVDSMICYYDEEAIGCALVAVDEIERAIKNCWEHIAIEYEGSNTHDYWQEVKEEIEKL